MQILRGLATKIRIFSLPPENRDKFFAFLHKYHSSTPTNVKTHNDVLVVFLSSFISGAESNRSFE